ncbi:MAG TPA: hypothetical protein VE983_12785, partial [Solirubrobacteraceae bacterium]|nr:hypothetical protein [Solirubrobacteraceae bacterium]
EHGTLPVKSLQLALDGRVVARVYRNQLTHRVAVPHMRRGWHTLRATTTDLAGDTRGASARFRRC